MMRAIAAVLIVTGTWALNFIYRDGTHTQGYCTFLQDGSRLTGVCGPDTRGGSPLTGAITDGQITWQVEDGPAYTAVPDEQGTFMRGSFTASGDGVFTASKFK